MTNDVPDDRIAAIVREVASGQRQNAGQLSAHLERAVRFVLKRHFAHRRDTKRLCKRVVEAIIEGVIRGEVANLAEFGAYARNVTLSLGAEPEPRGGLGSKLMCFLPWRSQAERAR